MREEYNSMTERGFDGPVKIGDGHDDDQKAVEQYQIPEVRDFPRQQTAADFAEIALDEGRVPIDDEEDEKKGFSRRKMIIAGLAAAVGIAAGGAFAVKAMNSNEGNNLPPENTPGNSAPQVPGQTESSAPEMELTAETVEFTVDGQTYTGVNGVIGALGQKLFKDNVANPKPLTEVEGKAMLANYMEAVKNAANMKVESGGEALLKEATDKLLFQEGTNPALKGLVHKIQDEGLKVTSVERPGLFGAPDAKYVQGQAYLNVENALGEKTQFYVSGAFFNDYGIYHADGNVSRVEEVTSK